MLIEKLTVPHLVQKYPAFHDNWNFLTVVTVARYFSLSWARLIQSRPSYFIFNSNVILPFHLSPGLPSSGFPTKIRYAFCFSPYVLHHILLQLIILIISGQQYTWWCSSLRISSSIPLLPGREKEVKLSLLTPWGVWREWTIAALVRMLGTRWNWIVCLTLGRFTYGEWASSGPWVGGVLGCRALLDVSEKRKSTDAWIRILYRPAPILVTMSTELSRLRPARREASISSPL
jgi:hypothetical protein